MNNMEDKTKGRGRIFEKPSKPTCFSTFLTICTGKMLQFNTNIPLLDQSVTLLILSLANHVIWPRHKLTYIPRDFNPPPAPACRWLVNINNIIITMIIVTYGVVVIISTVRSNLGSSTGYVQQQSNPLSHFAARAGVSTKRHIQIFCTSVRESPEVRWTYANNAAEKRFPIDIDVDHVCIVLCSSSHLGVTCSSSHHVAGR